MRHRTYTETDDRPILIADGAFVGVDMRRDPGQLEEGLVSEAYNIRFDHGVAQTRKGGRILGWTNKQNSSTRTAPLNPEASLHIPFDIIHGAGLFKDPVTQQEWILVAADGALYKIHENMFCTSVPLPAGVTLSGRVKFLQAFHKVIMMRGTIEDPDPLLEMSKLQDGFATLDYSTPTVGEVVAPDSYGAVFFQNRVFYIYDTDLVFPSRILDYTIGKNTISSFKINQGSADKLQALFRFNDTTLLAFKENSVYVIGDIYGDDVSANARLDAVTTEYGCVAPRAICQVGSDVWFLAHNRGIMSVRQTEQNKLQGVDVPVSLPIQPLIDRINWQFAGNAVAANWNNRIYFAVPIDDATRKFTAITPTGSTPNYTLSGLIIGATYFYEKGTNDTSLVCGTQTMTSSQYFDALATTAALTVSTGTSPGTVQRAWRGYNNCVLVYDLLNRAWSGYDQGDAICVREFIKAHRAGEMRLFTLSEDGFMRCYEDSSHEQTGTTAGVITNSSIPTRLVTRGYGGGETDTHRFRFARLNIGTWNPSYTVKSKTDGVEEFKNLHPTAITRSRTAYLYPFDAAAYDVTNTGDDYLTEGRADYSTALGASDTIDFKTGVDFSQHQEVSDRYRVNATGTELQIQIESTQGRYELHAVQVEANPGHRRIGTLA